MLLHSRSSFRWDGRVTRVAAFTRVKLIYIALMCTSYSSMDPRSSSRSADLFFDVQLPLLVDRESTLPLLFSNPDNRFSHLPAFTFVSLRSFLVKFGGAPPPNNAFFHLMNGTRETAVTWWTKEAHAGNNRDPKKDNCNTRAMKGEAISFIITHVHNF